jgi:hypothetical protein
MKFRSLVGAGLLLCSSFTLAEEIELNPSHPQTYVVVQGDTLWDIAGRFLTKPWQWPQIWHENPQVRNPHWIYPGDELTLSYVGGRPRLQVSRPSELRLSPEVRATPLARAIPVIPLNAIRQFLTHPKVANATELENAPYVVGFVGEHIAGGAGDGVYVRAIEEGAQTGYMIFRPGAAYKDGTTGEILGYEALYVAEAGLEAAGDPATLQLTQTDREVLIGDRVMPIESERLQMSYQPHAPNKMIRGTIISVVDGVTQIGQYQIVVIDRGTADGVEIGHVLDVRRGIRIERDIVSRQSGDSVLLPEEKEGVIMVFQPFERVSFALVMNATRAIHLRDIVQTP